MLGNNNGTIPVPMSPPRSVRSVATPDTVPGELTSTSTETTRWLRFKDNVLEEAFQRWLFDKMRRTFRLTYFLCGFISLFIYGLMMVWSEPEERTPESMALRVSFSSVPPLILLALSRRYSVRKALRHQEIHFVMYLLMLIPGLIVPAAMTRVLDQLYIALSLPLILATMPTLTRMRWLYTIFVCAITVVAYLVSSLIIFFDDIPARRQSLGFSVFFASYSILYINYSRTTERYMRNSYVTNLRLRVRNRKMEEQLAALRRDFTREEIDLDSPLEKALAKVRLLLASEHLGVNEIENVQFIATVLSSADKMLAPDLADQFERASSVDQDTKNWLFSEVAARNKQNRGTRRSSNFRYHVTDVASQRSSLANSGTLLPLNLLPGEEKILRSLLEQANEWQFDVFKLNEVSGRRPLFVLMDTLMLRHDFYALLGIDKEKFHVFLQRLEGNYKSVPYHCNIHAADVVHGANFFLMQDVIAQSLEPIEAFAMLLAAACHDVSHPGRNNQFQIATRSELALVYNDRSILENFHLSFAWKLIYETDVLAGLGTADMKTIRSLMIDMVLATDMASHFELVAAFKSALQGDDLGGAIKDDRTKRILVFKVLLKTADISNPAKPASIYRRWVDRVMEEFFLQGDAEKEAGLKISPFMDRSTSVPKCQLGFINYLVFPLYEAFVRGFLGLGGVFDHVLENRDAMASEEGLK